MGIIAERWLIDECVHLTVHRATGLRKLTGLIGRAELAPGTALGFTHCRSLHGIGMTRPLDVVFLDSRDFVSSVRQLRPGRFVSDRGACCALELRAGEAGRLGITKGSRLTKSTEGES